MADEKPRRRHRGKPEPEPPPALHPWDQQPLETGPAFHAFTIYRNLGWQRSLARVASELISQGKRRGTMMTVRRNIGEWSTKWRWVERATAFDRELDRQQQLADQRERRRMRERQAQLGEAAQASLSLPIRALVEKIQENPDLVTKLTEEDTVVLLDLVQKSVRALPAAVMIEREARGEDVTITTSFEAEQQIDRPTEEQRLRRVAAIMQQHGLLTPRTALPAPPPPIKQPEKRDKRDQP